MRYKGGEKGVGEQKNDIYFMAFIELNTKKNDSNGYK